MSLFSLQQVVDYNHHIQITCLESHKNRLLIGTQSNGVLVYEIGQASTGFESENKDIAGGQPISQLNIVGRSLLVLTLGELVIYNAYFGSLWKFYFRHTLDKKSIYKYTLFKDTVSSLLCIAVPGTLHIYEIEEEDFKIICSFDFANTVTDMVLTESRLFVVYLEKGSGTKSRTGYFDLSTRDFTPDFYLSQSYPPSIKYCGNDQIILHQDRKSTVYKETAVISELNWSISPREIQMWAGCCVGIRGNGVEVIFLDKSHSGYYTIQANQELTLQHITVGNHPFVATNNAVWRLCTGSSSMRPAVSTTVVPLTLGNPDEIRQVAETDELLNMENDEEYNPYAKDTISPHNSVSVLGLSKEDRLYLGAFKIYTVKEFSQLTAVSVKHFYGMKYWDAYIRAVYAVHKYEFAEKTLKDFSTLNQMKQLEADQLYSAPPIYKHSSLTNNNNNEGFKFTKPEYFTQGIFEDAKFKEMDENIYSGDQLNTLYNIGSEQLANKLEVFGNVFPEDPLEAIGLQQHYIEFLGTIDVFTVRQFAMMNHVEVCGYDDELAARHLLAVQCVEAHPEKAQKQIEKVTTGTHYGYIYMPATEYCTILENQEIKSAYVLFQEYLETEPDKRENHPWKKVYAEHLTLATSKFPPAEPNSEVILTDADVFSYICWAQARSFAKLDFTAGARAIYFYWYKLHPHQQKQLHDTARFETVIRINLSLLCHNFGGILFSRRNPKGNQWDEIPLDECGGATAYHAKEENKVDIVEYYGSPTGCIVLPTGIIPKNCIAAKDFN